MHACQTLRAWLCLAPGGLSIITSEAIPKPFSPQYLCLAEPSTRPAVLLRVLLILLRPSAASCTLTLRRPSRAGPSYNFNDGSTTAIQMSGFYNAQYQAYTQAGSAGWFLWSWKVTNNAVWGIEEALDSGCALFTEVSRDYVLQQSDFARVLHITDAQNMGHVRERELQSVHP